MEICKNRLQVPSVDVEREADHPGEEGRLSGGQSFEGRNADLDPGPLISPARPVADLVHSNPVRSQSYDFELQRQRCKNYSG
jgi:hypothetical protein